MREDENKRILTELCKLTGLSEYERHLIRKLSGRRNITPKEQALLLQMRDTHLGAKQP